MIAQPEIVVGAHIQDFPAADFDAGILRTFNNAFGFVKPGLADFVESCF